MNILNGITRLYPLLLILLTTLSSTICLAERGITGGFHGAGGFHNGGLNGNGAVHNGYHNDNYHGAGVYHHNNNYVGPAVGNYYPGAGWGAAAVVVNPNACQSIQQCDSNGNCVQTQECN